MLRFSQIMLRILVVVLYAELEAANQQRVSERFPLPASGITSNERASDGRQLATKCARGSNVPFDSLGGQGGRIPLRHEHDYLTETYRRRNILYVDDGNSCASAL